MKEKEQLANQGRYLEAENLKNKINEIKTNTVIQNKKELENRQIFEMRQLEDGYNSEIKAVNDYWNLEFQNFQNHYNTLTNNLEEKHKGELANIREYIEDKYTKNFKFSKEYLDLKTSEMNMVKQERYVEAHTIKQRCDYLEKIEIEKHMKTKEENLNLKIDNLIKQQALEKKSLNQKMNTEYDEMTKIKQIELDKIVVKYKNKKFELETKQGKEKNLHENENLLKANIFSSNLTNNVNNETMNKSFFNKTSMKMVNLNEPKSNSKRTLEVNKPSINNNPVFNSSDRKVNTKPQLSKLSGNNKSLKNFSGINLNQNLNSIPVSSNSNNNIQKTGLNKNLQYASIDDNN